MKNLMISILTIFLLSVCSVSISAENIEPGTSNLNSSASVLEEMNASLGGSNVSVSVQSNRSIAPIALSGTFGWGGEGLPGENGWTNDAPINVGAPVGDFSLPILLSMFFIYFLYRGVSSKKRKNI